MCLDADLRVTRRRVSASVFDDHRYGRFALGVAQLAVAHATARPRLDSPGSWLMLQEVLRQRKSAVLLIAGTISWASGCGGLTYLASSNDAGGAQGDVEGGGQPFDASGSAPDSGSAADGGRDSSARCVPMPGTVTIAPPTQVGLFAAAIDKTSVYWPVKNS